MKTLLLVISILSIVACIAFLLFAALNLFGYYHALDGTAELYRRLQNRAIICGVVGLAFAAIGCVCLVVRFKAQLPF